LIKPTATLGRHIFWSNFPITQFDFKEADILNGSSKDWKVLHGFDLKDHKVDGRKDKVYRNCVHPETGLHIFNCMLGKEKISQQKLFMS
jgi:hypothetical protein